MPYLKWSLNPYGGCVHKCRFCFAVQYRVVADQGTQQDFGTRLFIKTNFVEVLAREPGVRAGVLMAPVLPGITDSSGSIEAVAAAAREHKAASFAAVPLRLAPHVKEFYMGFVGDEYPDLLARYERAYPGTHAPQAYRDKLGERIERIRAAYGFKGNTARRGASEPPPPPRRGPQLAL